MDKDDVKPGTVLIVRPEYTGEFYTFRRAVLLILGQNESRSRGDDRSTYAVDLGGFPIGHVITKGSPQIQEYPDLTFLFKEGERVAGAGRPLGDTGYRYSIEPAERRERVEAEARGLQDSMLFAGYARWEPGQLEKEPYYRKSSASIEDLIRTPRWERFGVAWDKADPVASPPSLLNRMVHKVKGLKPL